MPSRSIPDIQIVPVAAKLNAPTTAPPVVPVAGSATDLREKRIEEFLQARSLAAKSQRAYQQDLQRFLNWTEQSWAAAIPERTRSRTKSRSNSARVAISPAISRP